MPSFVDGQIAAIAVTNQLTLVTRNVKDFLAEHWKPHSEVSRVYLKKGYFSLFRDIV